MKRGLRGINLGGWLVVERWMTPHLFDGVEGGSEIDLVRTLGHEKAKKRLIHHRNTFITESDFAWMAEHDIEVVRLPVGHWLFTQANGYIEGEEWVVRAFNWAEKYKLQIILDLHGLPGSQNGRAHSGKSGTIEAYSLNNIQKTLDTIKHLAHFYGHKVSLAAIELSNEPEWPTFGLRLWYYYRRAIKIVYRYAGGNVKIVISDGYRPYETALLCRLLPSRNRLVLDVHLYQIFTAKDRNKQADDYIKVVAVQWRTLIERLGKHTQIMVGEWSAAIATTPSHEEKFFKNYFQIQQQIFSDRTWAYCYWSYKAPNSGTWDYKAAVEQR